MFRFVAVLLCASIVLTANAQANNAPKKRTSLIQVDKDLTKIFGKKKDKKLKKERKKKAKKEVKKPETKKPVITTRPAPTVKTPEPRSEVLSVSKNAAKLCLISVFFTMVITIPMMIFLRFKSFLRSALSLPRTDR